MNDFGKESGSINPLIERINSSFGDPDPKVKERLKDRPEWVQKQSSGKVHIIPPEQDKHSMIGLNTSDKTLYKIFNEAASIATKDWRGFHQVGASNDDGLTAWELWNRPELTDEQILQGIKVQMMALAEEYY